MGINALRKSYKSSELTGSQSTDTLYRKKDSLTIVRYALALYLSPFPNALC